MSKPPLRPPAPPANLLKLAERLPTQRVQPVSPAAQAQGDREPTKPLTIVVRDRLKREIEDAAHQERTTARVIVLRALQQAGFSVRDEELIDGRAKNQKA